jgi:hypothetical protein
MAPCASAKYRVPQARPSILKGDDMSETTYDSTVPVFSHFLKAMSEILKKAEGHCETNKIDPDALLVARLFPDMFPLSRQVQLACDFAKGAGARLAGIPVPSFPDDEKTFAELQARITTTLDFLGTLKKEQFTGAATRTITLKIGGQEMSFPGFRYLHYFVFGNFFFHLATAYDILRHNGVEIGKRDFMGAA